MADFIESMRKKRGRLGFVIVTEDWSGLGFAKKLNDEGAEVVIAAEQAASDEGENYWDVGRDMVPVMEIGELLKDKEKYRDFYFIWDGNHHAILADKLRESGFKVLGGGVFAEKSEHDRAYGVELIKKAGINVPPTEEFSNVHEAIAFLNENEDKAYVFKPNEPSAEGPAWKTTLPDNERNDKANLEMQRFLESFPDTRSSFILQERKKGVELNVEFWLYDGRPFFAFANFECKRKYNADLGPLVGCAHDIGFVVPVDSKVVRDTLAKLLILPEYGQEKGLAFRDLNIVVGDKEYWFLEFCNRLGYNSHPNLFLNLANKPISQILAQAIDGKIKDFDQNFKDGFGASINMYIDEPTYGLPITIPPEIADKFYHFDTYLDGEEYRLAGYSQEVGIICAHDYDLKSAADEVLQNAKKISYPSKAYRSDINLTDYLTNPWERHIAAKEMRLFERVQDEKL